MNVSLNFVLESIYLSTVRSTENVNQAPPCLAKCVDLFEIAGLLIFPVFDMVCGATAGQKQSAGCEYECDGFFHGMVFNTEYCVWFRPNFYCPTARSFNRAAQRALFFLINRSFPTTISHLLQCFAGSTQAQHWRVFPFWSCRLGLLRAPDGLREVLMARRGSGMVNGCKSRQETCPEPKTG